MKESTPDGLLGQCQQYQWSLLYLKQIKNVFNKFFLESRMGPDKLCFIGCPVLLF